MYLKGDKRSVQHPVCFCQSFEMQNYVSSHICHSLYTQKVNLNIFQESEAALYGRRNVNFYELLCRFPGGFARKYPSMLFRMLLQPAE